VGSGKGLEGGDSGDGVDREEEGDWDEEKNMNFWIHLDL
jgi:hypothetical protein